MDDLLKRALSGNIPHAILLECEDLKKSNKLSKEIIKNLFCGDHIKNEAVINIVSNKIDKEIHPDVIILECLEKAKTIGVNEIRNVKQKLYVKPNESLYKVCVIKGAETLTVQAQNALLKVLEEPPKNVVFILLCKSSSVLLDTIISRVQKFMIDENASKNEGSALDGAQRIAEAVLSTREIFMMEATAGLVKDRKLFKDTMLLVIDIFSEAILCKNYSKYEICVNEVVKKLSKNMSESRLFSFIDIFQRICFLADNNVNMNLMLSYLSAYSRELAIL